MEKRIGDETVRIVEFFGCFMRKCVFSVLSAGCLPAHIAFIMDGNRRYAKTRNLLEGDGHRHGYLALLNMLKYCYELRIKYVTIYAFSIDNFKRRPEEVQSTMKLIEEKIEELIKEESMLNHYGVRIYFLGNLKLLSKPVRLAAEKAMVATAGNLKAVLSVCLAYTSTDEILHAVQESCEEKWDEINELDRCGAGYGLIRVRGNQIDGVDSTIDAADVEKHMYAAAIPDPDIIVRSSGETRLSNFLLWQSARCLLYSPSAFWPEIGFQHLVWAVLEFQRHSSYLKQSRKSEVSSVRFCFGFVHHFVVWSVGILTILRVLGFSLPEMWGGLWILFGILALREVMLFFQ